MLLRAVVCLSRFLTKQVRSDQVQCLDGMKTSQHMALQEKVYNRPDGGGKSFHLDT